MQNIDIYYESLKQVYDQILHWAEKPPLRKRILRRLLDVAGICFILSLIPVLPAIFVLFGPPIELALGSLDLGTAKFEGFILVWISAGVGTGIIFAMFSRYENVQSLAEKPTGPPQTLSPEQVTFIEIYHAYKELKVYFVSHVDQHVENSLEALTKILPSAWWAAIDPLQEERIIEQLKYTTAKMNVEDNGEATITYWLHGHSALIQARLAASLPRQISVAQTFLQTLEKYAWFQLDTATKSILQALVSFPEKIPYRLKERYDLPNVLNVLENMSKFTYAYLPEHKTYMDPEAIEELQAKGLECLKYFAQQVNDLTHYQPAPESKETKIEISLRERLQGYYYQNVFVRFILWFILILILTTGAVFLFNQRVQLSPDTMAKVIIGTSVTGAAALAGFLPRSSKPA
jgi:hypothetical protein